MEETLEEIDVFKDSLSTTVKAAKLLNLDTLDIERNTEVKANLGVSFTNNIYAPEHLAYYPPNEFAITAPIIPMGVLVAYEYEAKYLIESIENKQHSIVKKYLYLFSLIKLINNLGSIGMVERAWNRNNSLKDVYYRGLDFKVKLYLGPKAGISIRFLTTIHNIHKDIFKVAIDMEHAAKEIRLLNKIIDKANILGDKLYVKYKKKYGVK